MPCGPEDGCARHRRHISLHDPEPEHAESKPLKTLHLDPIPKDRVEGLGFRVC